MVVVVDVILGVVKRSCWCLIAYKNSGMIGTEKNETFVKRLMK